MIVNYASPRIDGTTGAITVLIHVGKPADDTKKDSSGLREVPAADEVLTPAHRAALLEWLGIDNTQPVALNYTVTREDIDQREGWQIR